MQTVMIEAQYKENAYEELIKSLKTGKIVFNDIFVKAKEVQIMTNAGVFKLTGIQLKPLE